MLFQLETARLILRNYCDSDLTDIQRLKAEKLIWEFSTNKATDDPAEARRYLESLLKSYSEQRCNFQALIWKDTGHYVGEAGVLSFNEHNKKAVIGYNLLPEYWHQGFATEITSALVAHLFEISKLERIEALTMEGNVASRRVLEKCGLIQEGLLRNYVSINNRFHNVCYYGMIKSDYYK